MLVLSDEPEQLGDSATARENRRMTEVARLLGCQVYTIPGDFERCGTAEAALWHVPRYERPTPTVWVGFLPAFDRYEQIYAAARAKNLVLVNDPEQHLIAMELDRAYPYLDGLTPESLVVRSPEECAGVGAQLGNPLFVKGAIQSRKRQGWSFCVASDEARFVELTRLLLGLEEGSRGRVIARRLVGLRHDRTTGLGMPVGREFRFFTYGGEVLAGGYHWDEADDQSELSPDERGQVEGLARVASARLPVPYVALDIGQLETGEWIVIEANDAQFSGRGQVTALQLWSALKARVDAGGA